MTGKRVCPVCGEPLPEPARTGRPRGYCSAVCTERARTRRKKAARLLEFADRLEAHVGARMYGSAEHILERVAGLREDAEELLQGIPR